MKRLTLLTLALVCAACGGSPEVVGDADAHVDRDAHVEMDAGTSPTDDAATTERDADEGCTGCIASTGDCVSGESNLACGQGGAACIACIGIELCADGECLPPPACSPLDCDGCCEGDVCVEGTSMDACGSSGAVCESCTGDATCDEAAGRRRCVMHCGPDNCGGCCDATGRCVTEMDAGRCGTGGDLCSACGSGETCGAGVCVSEECAATCEGCCLPDGTCDDGHLDETCGWAGEACTVCAPGLDCFEGCRPDVGSETCRGCYLDGICVEGEADDACGEDGRRCHDCTDLGLECATIRGGVQCSMNEEARYDLYVLSFDVGSDVSGWDAFGGLPDFYVHGYYHYPVDTEYVVAVTPTISDSLVADWGRHLLFSDLTVEQVTYLDLDVYDEDPLDDDEGRGCNLDFDEDHPHLIQRALLNGEIYNCLDNAGRDGTQSLRIQLVRR